MRLQADARRGPTADAGTRLFGIHGAASTRNSVGRLARKVALVWAQLITVRLKDDSSGELERVMDRLRAAEQPDSGLVRQTVLRDRSDPRVIRTLAVFESEEKARAREADPRRATATAEVQARLQALIDGPPEFDHFDILLEFNY